MYDEILDTPVHHSRSFAHRTQPPASYRNDVVVVLFLFVSVYGFNGFTFFQILIYIMFWFILRLILYL